MAQLNIKDISRADTNRARVTYKGYQIEISQMDCGDKWVVRWEEMERYDDKLLNIVITTLLAAGFDAKEADGTTVTWTRPKDEPLWSPISDEFETFK